jgi:hypothetical protein
MSERRRALMQGDASLLPSEYKQLECVKHREAACIQLPAPNRPYTLEADLVVILHTVAMSEFTNHVIGTGIGWDNAGHAVCNRIASDDVFFVSGNRYQITAYRSDKAVEGTYYVNGVDTGIHASQDAYYFRIGGTNDYGATQANFDLYSLVIKRGDDIIQNYVPALRKEDNIAGLYETISGKFYYKTISDNNGFTY